MKDSEAQVSNEIGRPSHIKALFQDILDASNEELLLRYIEILQENLCLAGELASSLDFLVSNRTEDLLNGFTPARKKVMAYNSRIIETCGYSAMLKNELKKRKLLK